jgi:hypothetical protein
MRVEDDKSFSLAMMTDRVMMAAVMRTSVGGNDSSDKDDQGDGGEHNVTDLHGYNSSCGSPEQKRSGNCSL